MHPFDQSRAQFSASFILVLPPWCCETCYFREQFLCLFFFLLGLQKCSHFFEWCQFQRVHQFRHCCHLHLTWTHCWGILLRRNWAWRGMWLQWPLSSGMSGIGLLHRNCCWLRNYKPERYVSFCVIGKILVFCVTMDWKLLKGCWAKGKKFGGWGEQTAEMLRG